MTSRRADEAGPQRGRLPAPAVLVVGALAALGAITLVQWALSAVLGVIRLAIFVVVVVAVGAWVVSTKAGR